MAAAGGSQGAKETKKRAQLAMMELTNMISVPMALNTVVRLNIPDAIWSSGSNAPLSAEEILNRIRPPLPPSASSSAIQRLLRLLASHGVVAELHQPPAPRRCSLTEIGQTLISPEPNGPSYAAYVLQHHQDALVRAWPWLHSAVEDPEGPEAFAKANGGVGAFEYYGKDPESNALMQRAMRGGFGAVHGDVPRWVRGGLRWCGDPRGRRWELRRLPEDDHGSVPEREPRCQLRSPGGRRHGARFPREIPPEKVTEHGGSSVEG